MLQIPNNVSPKDIESDFQKNWDLYWHSSNICIRKKAWERMWWNVIIANSNIAKSIYKKRSVIVPEEKLEEIIIDSSAYVMKFVEKGVRPTKLSSYNFLRVLKFINDPKEIERTEHEVLASDWIESLGEENGE